MKRKNIDSRNCDEPREKKKRTKVQGEEDRNNNRKGNSGDVNKSVDVSDSVDVSKHIGVTNNGDVANVIDVANNVDIANNINVINMVNNVAHHLETTDSFYGRRNRSQASYWPSRVLQSSFTSFF